MKKRYKPLMGKAGNPNFRREGHPVCEWCPHDMTMMLETIRGAGTRPERISPAKWISLLGDGLPCCRDVKVPGHGTGPFRIYGQVSVSDRGKGTLLPGGNAVVDRITYKV